jgi:cell division protein FtsB
VRRHPWLLVSLVGLLAVLVLGSFPVRAYFSQTDQRRALEAEAARLAAGNDVLLEQIARLKTDEVVEQLARERFHLVKPGEEAYALLPDGEPPVEEPRTASAADRTGASQKQGLLSRAWARVVSIF